MKNMKSKLLSLASFLCFMTIVINSTAQELKISYSENGVNKIIIGKLINWRGGGETNCDYQVCDPIYNTKDNGNKIWIEGFYMIDMGSKKHFPDKAGFYDLSNIQKITFKEMFNKALQDIYVAFHNGGGCYAWLTMYTINLQVGNRKVEINFGNNIQYIEVID